MQPLDLKNFSELTDAGIGDRYDSLFKLYIFADQYSLLSLMNDLMKVMCEKFPIRIPSQKTVIQLPDIRMVSYAWSHTTDDSPLRKVLVYLFIYHVNRDFFQKAENKAKLAQMKDLALDLVPAYSRRITHPNEKCPHCAGISSLLV